MGKEKRKILEMLAKGKITIDEAEKLLSALSGGGSENEEKHTTDEKTNPKYLRIAIEPTEGSKKKDKVNVRVPFKLIRSGIKWISFIPKEAREKVNESLRDKGIDMDFTKLTEEGLAELVENLSDLTIEVEGEEKVRVYCE
jgi:polyhydroxyalkanoate synthesis regulator phasin